MTTEICFIALKRKKEKALDEFRTIFNVEKRVDIFPPDRGMLRRRSRRVQILIRHINTAIIFSLYIFIIHLHKRKHKYTYNR